MRRIPRATPSQPARTRPTRARPAGQPDLDELQALVVALPPARQPRATYRVQFHAGFTFQDAAGLAPYLKSLGISDLYASPYVRARSGSTHGYDVADPNQLNPELGTEQDYQAMVAALRAQGMGQLVDVVPNHMGVGDPGNYRWRDVLENGPASVYAHFFDINWNPLKPAELKDQERLILPVLGGQYGQVLENGELQVHYQDGAFSLHYYEHVFPLAPESYTHLLELALDHVREALPRRHEHVEELRSILTALRHLPPRSAARSEEREERGREKEIVKRRIRTLHQASAEFREELDAALREFAGEPGNRASFDRLDALLDDQVYRLAFWRVAAEEINYRRFFDIQELAAVRMEDPSVFEETHRLLLRLVAQGNVIGLRIDHPDGLWDPAGYFWRLQRSCFIRLQQARLRHHPAAAALGDGLPERLGALFDRERARDPASPMLRPTYVVAEKILALGEELPADWPIHGTTGYEFLNVLNGIFVDRASATTFERIYHRYLRATPRRFADIANASKKMMMLISLGSEVNELAYHLKRIASADRRHRDFTLNLLAFAIREVIASLAVYRTYANPATGTLTAADRAYVEAAVADAKRRNARTDPSLFDFVRDTLLLRHEADLPSEQAADRLKFMGRFQQATGPVMAKGVEDTAFYIYNRLVSLNEVGGEPGHFGLPVGAFHRFNRARARGWPSALLATSTHDTKRSEDVRARLNALSELPRDWRAALVRWSRANARHRVPLAGRRYAPDRNEEYLFYQLLLGAWPLKPPGEVELRQLCQRLVGAMLKSAKEAKVNTSWINPSPEYEDAIVKFVGAVLTPGPENAFLDDFSRHPLRERIAELGMVNSLAQTLLKITAPGVPDFYQGNELWDFSLVDPDNRRPVDYRTRARLLARLKAAEGRHPAKRAGLAAELWRERADGRIKLYLTTRALEPRSEQPELFARGSYLPLKAGGGNEAARHVVAFARILDQHPPVVTVAPVLTARLTARDGGDPLGPAVWRDGWCTVPGSPGSRYTNVLTGEVLSLAEGPAGPAVRLAEVFATLPIGLLVGLAANQQELGRNDGTPFTNPAQERGPQGGA